MITRGPGPAARLPATRTATRLRRHWAARVNHVNRLRRRPPLSVGGGTGGSGSIHVHAAGFQGQVFRFKTSPRDLS